MTELFVDFTTAELYCIFIAGRLLIDRLLEAATLGGMPVDAKVLKQRRESLGLTQQQVADAAHMPQQAYARIESGKRGNPSFKTVEALSDALGLRIDDMRTRPKRR